MPFQKYHIGLQIYISIFILPLSLLRRLLLFVNFVAISLKFNSG